MVDSLARESFMVCGWARGVQGIGKGAIQGRVSWERLSVGVIGGFAKEQARRPDASATREAE